jgi:branched-chain amino acid transport system permease protein
MSRVRALVIGVWPLLGVIAIVAAIAVLVEAFGGSELRSITANGLINLMLVVGIYIFIGNSGVLSFGHISFAAIGAYTSALLTIPVASKSLILPDLPTFLADAHVSTPAATLLGAAAAGVFALLASVPLMRLGGIAAGIATFALLAIVQVVAQNWDSVTGGLGTLTSIPSDLGVLDLLGWCVVGMTIAFAYQRSRFGQRLRGSREDEVAARALGVRVEGERRFAFVLSALVTGGGGALYAHYLGAIAPNAFYVDLTFLTIAMLVVGGMRSLLGAVVGTITLTALTQVFYKWEGGGSVGPIALDVPDGLGLTIVAALLLAVLLLRPDGLTRSAELPVPRWLARPPRGGDAPASEPEAERGAVPERVAAIPDE